MITKPFQNITLSRLGMGNMRLPSVNPGDPNAPIDYPKAHEIIDHAYNNGINYFDTAWVYNNGDSEKCLGEAMKKFPRDSFYLATKFNIGANPDYKYVFEEQLRRLQTDRIDFYLLHCLTDDNITKYLESGAIEYFLEQKEKGRISYLGFSSHSSVETLRQFADHHQWDFAQLQINYFDWFYGDTPKEYQILADRNIPAVVMEPVRGGRLADLTEEANAILKKAHPDWSIASWAFRFVKGLPNVQVILSGMSTMDQIKDNLQTFASDDTLTEEDMAVLRQAADCFRTQLQIPCTACRYCTGDCPMEINIPEYMSLFNKYKVDGPWAFQDADKIKSAGTPEDCIGCGTCAGHCPQNIDIPSILSELADAMAKRR